MRKFFSAKLPIVPDSRIFFHFCLIVGYLHFLCIGNPSKGYQRESTEPWSPSFLQQGAQELTNFPLLVTGDNFSLNLKARTSKKVSEQIHPFQNQISFISHCRHYFVIPFEVFGRNQFHLESFLQGFPSYHEQR